MKHTHCQKCEDNQRKAGEALSLFNEASGELLDAEWLLREALTRLSAEDTLRPRIEEFLKHFGERKTVENGIREIIRPT